MYSQNDIDIKRVNEYITGDKLDSLEIYLNYKNKDSVNYSDEKKAKLYFALALFNEYSDFEDESYRFFKKAEKLFEKTENNFFLADIQLELFYLLNSRNFDEALKQLDKYHVYAIENIDTIRISKAYMAYASIYFNPKEFKKAEFFYNEIIELSLKIKDTLSLAKAYNNKAILISNFYKNQDSTRFYYQKILEIHKQTKKNEEEHNLILNIGTSYKNEGNYKKAIEWFLNADKISVKKYKYGFKKLLYANLANSYHKIKNYKKAYHYFELYDAYKDSVSIEEQNVAIADLDKKYQTEKKEKENILLREQKKIKDFYIRSILGVLIGIIIIGILIVITLKKKREIAEKNTELEHQLVISLVKEQEIRSMDAMVEGQELERKRIAEDLHDNLGSTLATLKLHFDNYRETFSVKNNKQIELLNSTEKILDEAYDKVRAMAHTNSSSEMDEYGLIDAVKTLVRKVSLPEKTMFEFIEYGFDKPINNSLELIVFRTIQELITNIVKHAKATKATIDLTLFDDSLSLTVEDNGIGFKNKEFQESGMGLGSIKERIIKINGTFEIDSTIGLGSTILINIPLLKEM